MSNPVIIGDCTLYCGDSISIIPTLQPVDIVISDPPYGTAYLGGYRRGQTEKDRHIKNDDDLSITSIVLRLCVPLCDGTMSIFYSPRVAPLFHRETHFMEWYGQIIWDKKAVGLGSNLRYKHENIGLFGEIKLNNAFSLYSYFRDADKHPHQKPIPIMKQLLEVIDANTILDPFMGSGSTGVACAMMGRKFIGVELDQKYFDIACQRIEKAYQQPDLFVDYTQPEQEVMEL